MSGEWNATKYDRIADPMARWGTGMLDRLALRGDETVLDAGCGSGRVTERLLERLPDGRVVALDASSAMLAEARRRLARFGRRVAFVHADLARPLPLDEPVDAILSTATFHWVLDHDALFANLAAAVRPGGRLVAQCGGAGNIATLRSVLDALGVPPAGDLRFETALATARHLTESGFVDVETWLSFEPTRFEPGEPFETYLETVCLRSQLARLPADERPGFVRTVATRMPRAELDYVRLNIVARRSRARAG
jgi:trans-aconitate 2-methyltransferase